MDLGCQLKKHTKLSFEYVGIGEPKNDDITSYISSVKKRGESIDLNSLVGSLFQTSRGRMSWQQTETGYPAGE